MKKRMLSLLLAVLMVVAMIPMTALAAETSTITATADKTADLKKGDTVEVTFAIANNPGVCAMEANLVYNNKVLKFTGLKMKEDDYGTSEYVGILRSGSLVVNKGKGRIVWANATDVTASNTLFVAQFEVVGTGETTVSLTLDEYRKVGGAESKDAITITPSATVSVASVAATEVTLDATSATMYPGDEKNLKVTVTPEDSTDEIVWTSSDESVAIVKNGAVTALQAGSTTITAKANDTVFAACEVTVKNHVHMKQKSGEGEYAEVVGYSSGATQFNYWYGGEKYTMTPNDVYVFDVTQADTVKFGFDDGNFNRTGVAVCKGLDGMREDKLWFNGDAVKNGKEFAVADIVKYALVTYEDVVKAFGDKLPLLNISESDTLAFMCYQDQSGYVMSQYGILLKINSDYLVPATKVELDKTELTLKLGVDESVQLTATVTPEDTTDVLSWSSDKETVATVDQSGKVTPVAAGTAKITATAGNVSASCTVTVAEPIIHAYKTTKGNYLKQLAITGVDAIEYASDWVDDGTNVTTTVVLPKGTADGTVITNDFVYYWYDQAYMVKSETKTATLENGTAQVTFEYKPLLMTQWDTRNYVVNYMLDTDVESLTLDRTELTLIYNTSDQLTATVKPDNLQNTLKWTSSDSSVVTVDANGKIKAVGSGTATITAEVMGKTATCTVTVPEIFSATDIPYLDSQISMEKILVLTDATIQSSQWDGDVLNIVMAEGTADGTAINVEFHIDGPDEDLEYNVNGEDYHAYDTMVTESVTVSDGKASVSCTVQPCTCGEGDYDFTFTGKTYTLNFTVEGGAVTPSHTITIADTTNGTVTADKTTATKGDTVTLTIAPDDGYKLDTLTAKAGDTEITVTDNKFTMPDADVTVTATFVEEEPEVPETSILVKAEADVAGTVTIVEKGKVNIGSYTDVPYQIIQVPVGTTSVDVTFVAGTEFADYGMGAYCYKVDINAMTSGYGPGSYALKTNADGTITVTVPIANFKYEDGYGIALEKPSWNPVNLMTFQQVESSEPPHTCVFNQQNTDSKYRKSEATCESPAVYYYSCTCGEKGTETFTYGDKADHIYENGSCTGCGQPDPDVSQYTVALEGGKTVSAGEIVEIPVTIGHTDSTVTTYNAFDLSFTYDPAALQLDMADITDLTITDSEGTLRILRYGASKNVGEPAFTLKFTALTAGETNITTSAALVGISNGAIEGDANTAAVTTKTTGVIVEGYTVNLPEGFTGESKVQSGESYTFTANDKNYTYDLSATMGGEAVTVTDNGDGSFTIANVTGNLVIKLDQKTGKIFNVTLVGDGLIGPATAKYMEDYTAQLTEESGYSYKYAVTVNGQNVVFSHSGSNITINGWYITGDVKIVVTRTAIAPSTYSVSFEGNAAGEANGASSVTANATYTFTVNKAEGATYTVTATMGGKETTVTETDNGYSITKVTGDLVITVNKQTDLTVEVSTYLELDGKTLFLVKANGTLPDGYAYAYDGTAMFKSEAYDGSWVYLVMVENGTLTAEDAKAKIVSAEMDYTTLSKTCDVNGTGKVDVNDAQLVYDLYNTKYQDFSQVSMEKFLKADTTADGKVDVADATAIVSEINNLR